MVLFAAMGLYPLNIMMVDLMVQSEPFLMGHFAASHVEVMEKK